MSNTTLPARKFCPLISYLFLLITVAAGVTARTIQLFFAIDEETGFYKNHYSVPFLTAVLWIGLVGCLVFAFLSDRSDMYDRFIKKKSRIFLGFVIFTGLLFALQAAGKIVVAIIAVVSKGKTFLTGSEYFMVFLLLLSCVAFIVAGVNYIKGHETGIIMIIPPLYMSISLMLTFMSYTTIANISEHLFEIIFLCAAAVFLCTFAKATMTKIGKTSEGFLVVSGIFTAVFGFLTSIPHYIKYGFMVVKYYEDFETLKQHTITVHLDQLATSVLALVFIGSYLLNIKRKNKKVKAGNETQQALPQ